MSTKSIVAAALLCPLLAISAAAQQTYPLREIVIDGLHNFDRERVLAATGLEIGSQVTADDLQKAVDRLGAAGVFEAIEFRYGPLDGGYTVTFTVREVEQLYAVRFQGFEEPDEELYRLLEEKVPLFSPLVPPTGVMARRIGNTLNELWRSQGNESDVTGRLAPIEDGRLAMLYGPETRLRTIAFVKFQGGDVISNLELQRTFNQSAMGEPYTEARVKELLHFNVRPLYEEFGRMNVTFCPCTAEADPDSQGLLITVSVDEGPQFTYGEVTPPDIPGLEPERTAKLFPFASGKPVNMKAVRDAQARIEETLRKQGFMRVSSDLEAPADNEANTVSLALSVSPGAQYAFQDLTIRGLDIISEPIVRKRWGLKRGDAYNPTYPGFFLERIRQEGMFDNLADTSYREEIDENGKTVNVTLDFLGRERKEEFPTTKIEEPF